VVIAIGVAFFTSVSKNNQRVRDELDKSTWRTYSDTQEKFEFRYPPTLAANKSANRVFLYGVSDVRAIGAELIIDKNSKINESEYTYLNFPQTGKIEIEGKQFIEFKAPNGFCENDRCGRPFSAYTTKRNSDYYTFVFYDDDKLSPQERVILSELKYN